MKLKWALSALFGGWLMTVGVQAETVNVELQLPVIKSGQYKRPYVAVWVERQGDRRALSTLAIWYEDKKWLKDIRRWWRKAGRYDKGVDAVTGATRPPGSYRLSWDGKDNEGKALLGDFLLCLEAVREHGNRTLFKQKIRLGDKAQHYTIAAGKELGLVHIKVGD